MPKRVPDEIGCDGKADNARTWMGQCQLLLVHVSAFAEKLEVRQDRETTKHMYLFRKIIKAGINMGFLFGFAMHDYLSSRHCQSTTLAREMSSKIFRHLEKGVNRKVLATS